MNTLVVAVSDLSFRYTAGDAAVRGLTFAIGHGEIFGFLGPSGAGKSTTQNILTGLLGGYTGSVQIWGRSPQAWGSELYERIGVAFELPTHFRKLTALENLAYFAALYRRKVLSPLQALELVGLQDAGNLLVEQFSKGMQNRLSIARALLHGPELLFLDEPTSGLDPVSARMIQSLIAQQRAAGTTVFLTTHTMALAERLCDRVAFLVDGEIRLIDSPHTLQLQYGSAEVLVVYTDNAQTQEERFPIAGLGCNQAFLQLLRTRQVQTIHSSEASLDDIFVQITGRSLA
jgi:fluoroquinolone transport system ATP-binding protein